MMNQSIAPPFDNGGGWLNKVPEVTLVFWLVKMMSTTVGETAADFLNVSMGFGLVGTAIVTGILLAAALCWQLCASRYAPVRYWLVVVFISVFGTLITDNLTDRLNVPLMLSSLLFGAALTVTFVVWYAREKTLSIHAVDSLHRELFYWLAILFTFALGTAAGDWLAEGFNIGYGNAALVFGGMIALTALVCYAFNGNRVACFWVAYVLTRPFGAACGDLLAQPAREGGLGLGVTGTSLLFLMTIIGLVAYLAIVDNRPSNQPGPALRGKRKTS